MNTKTTTKTKLNPRRGEVWFIDFNPQTGSEIKNDHPAVVIGLDSIGNLPLRIVVPMTSWQDKFVGFPWHIPIRSHKKKEKSYSSADCVQVKSISLKRFKNRIGRVSAKELKEILAGVALAIGYTPD